MRTVRLAAALLLTMLVSGRAPAAESLVTVRFGEQDSCRARDVTKLRWDEKLGQSRLRFDVSRLPRQTRIARSLLCFWVAATDPNGAACRQFGFGRWRDPEFDGFKVWEGSEPKPDRLLDTRYPFHVPSYWRVEFDVTTAVRKWVADPGANQGLATNFRFPVAAEDPAETAWQRPYLEITYADTSRDRPRQPRDLKARYRAGQVFLTWKQIPHDGPFFDATYRVYRHDRPITAENLHRATLLGEVHRLAQLNYRRTLTARGGPYGPWKHYVAAAGQPPYKKGESQQQRQKRILPLLPRRFNFVIDDTWPQRTDGGRFLREVKPSEQVQIYQGPQLDDATGLFVHTCRTAGKACFAVTSVIEGNENRQDFTAGNALAEAVEQQVARPQPVLQAVFTANGPGGYGKVGKFQVREYVYWEGGEGRLHSEPSTPFCFTFHVPLRWVGLGHEHGPEIDRDFPPWICSLAKVAGYSISYWDGRGVVMDTAYLPPTRWAPFPPGRGPSMHWPEYACHYYGSQKPRPEKPDAAPGHVLHSVFGYVGSINSGDDPRKEPVRPYFENRRLLELDSVLGGFPADPNYVWASGEGSTLNFVLHHAGRFACAQTSQERAWKSERGAPQHEALVGLRAWGLKTGGGHDVWDYNDPVWLARKFPGRTWPVVSNCHSDNYDGADNWNALGFPQLYLDLAREKRAAQLWWCDIGDAPQAKFLAVPRNQAYPVLTSATFCETPAQDWRSQPRGTLNGYAVWHRPNRPFVYARKPPEGDGAPAPPGRPLAFGAAKYGQPLFWAALSPEMVDTPSRFEMALRIGEDGLILNGQSVPPFRAECGAADITLRRLQAFRVDKGRKYRWRNVKVATGQVLQTGLVTPDDLGRLTVPQFLLDKDVLGNKLVVEPDAGRPAPAVDATQTVVVTYFRSPQDRHHGKFKRLELSYSDYVARCREPELVPKVKPGRVFKAADFQNLRGFRGDGLYSMWGGGFEDALEFPADGRYRVEVETSESYFQHVAWPILSLSVDSRKVGERLLDSEKPATHTWWIDAAQGRHLLRFSLENNIFNEPFPRHGDQDPRPDRGFRLLGVRFVPLGERPRDVKDVYAVSIRQRSLVTGPGIPLRMTADVVDPWGEPLPITPAWSTSEGATISAEGVFVANEPGSRTVTATAGGKTDAVTVRVDGNAWVESFDDQWADGWSATSTGVQKQDDQAQWFVTRHHDWVGMLSQRNWRSSGDHLFVWEAGRPWSDVTVAVDRLTRNQPVGPVQGVVFRYQDSDNYYRFQLERAGDRKTLRLIKRTGGRQTTLATTDQLPGPLRIADPRSYPSFRHWGHKSVPGELSVDRFEVTARGVSIRARFNGKEVFSVEDGDLKRGTVGLYCRGGALLDNVRVTVPR